MHLVKPAHLDVLPEQTDVVCADDGQLAGQLWLEYPYRKFHPIIRWLPTKLAGLNPVVTISARDTDDPALEIHSTTPAWH